MLSSTPAWHEIVEINPSFLLLNGLEQLLLLLKDARKIRH